MAENRFTIAATDPATVVSLVGTAAMGSGTANSTTFLRGDGTWAVPAGGLGEINTASNVGAAGVGLFKQKLLLDLEFKKLNAGSARVTITDDTGNSEVDIDVPANAFEAAGAVAAHEAASDPHGGYQRESERNVANGYAGLDGSSKLTGSQQVYGTGANTACVGNDSRLSDARTPTAHKASHQSGADALELHNANTADVTANAADTYLTGSNLAIGGKLKVGTKLRWRLVCTKTAAGTATAAFNIRFGTNGSTADTARNTFTLSAATAATDVGWFDIEAIVRSVSATGTVSAGMQATHQTAGTTGLWSANETFVAQAVSAQFDNSGASLQVGVSVNPGTAGVWTFQIVSAEAVNLA